MKHLLLFTIYILVFAVYCKSQQSNIPSNTTKVVLENDKLKVVEYSSTTGKDMCGRGLHSHAPHLTIFLTDAIVKVTTTDGKAQGFDLKAGTTLWSESDTHIAVNNGRKPAKVYLIEVK